MSSPTTAAHPADPRTLRRVVGAGFLGTTIEYYDFFIYGTAAALVFPKVFFPELGAAAATTASFATFAVAFVARPFGGVVFGHLGDRAGRKATLVATLTIMGLSTVLIGALPSGHVIGAAAPVVLIALRFLQGLAVGGEWSTAALFVGEYAPDRKRGLYALAPTLGTSAGLLLSTVTFLITGVAMSTETFLSWGWRIPFLLSIVLVAVGLWVRLGVADTPVFLAAQAKAEAAAKAKLPLAELLRHQWKQMLLAAGAILMWQPFFTIGGVFLINYGTTEIGLSHTTMLTVNIVAIGFNIAGSVTGGKLADRIGRRRSMMTANGFGIVWAFALFPLADTGNPVLLGLGISATLFFVGTASSTMTAYMPELFRTAYRSTGTGAAFNLGSALGGAVPSIIAAPLIAAFGGTGVAVMLAAFALVATASIFFLSETRGDSLDEAATAIPRAAARHSD
ncbi:MFS transporter [Amycolatopsis thermoflava]|uniref:MFS transporter n=1 Tax=Amycolatopsis thermoflava TaxID=84480 RepID=UPI00380D980D